MKLMDSEELQGKCFECFGLFMLADRFLVFLDKIVNAGM